ncbi:MAG: hypothetical protein ACE5GR_08760 [Nitrosopumilus sp.]
MNNHAVGKLATSKLKDFPNVNSLLKISLGLVFFTIISTVLVYAETISVNVEGNSYNVEYIANQVIINSVVAEYEPSSNYAGLIFNVEVTGDSATLDFVFERTFFDSIYNGLDDPFFVLADGIEADFSEITTSQSRTLSIKLPSGTEDLEIIGTVFGQSIEPPVEQPVVQPPVEQPVVQPPVEQPVVQPPVEEPAVEPPVMKETPVEEKTKTQCGAGTILQDGMCVLDERCGPGTVLEDGVCVLKESIPQPSTTSVKGMGKELIYGIIAAFVVTGAIAIILALMSKASKSRD